MPDIDLIPGSFRDTARVRRWLVRAGAGLALVVVAAVAGSLWLARLTGEARREVEVLTQRKAQAARTTAQAAEVAQQRAETEQLLARLEALTSGRVTEGVLLPLDRALNGGVLFDELSYARTAVAAPAAPPAAPSASAPVAASAATTPAAGGERRVAVLRKLELRGRAADHQALGSFAAALAAQREFADVRVVNSSVRRYSGSQVLDFGVELAVAAASQPGEAR